MDRGGGWGMGGIGLDERVWRTGSQNEKVAGHFRRLKSHADWSTVWGALDQKQRSFSKIGRSWRRSHVIDRFSLTTLAEKWTRRNCLESGVKSVFEKSDFQDIFAFLDLLPMMSVVFSFHFSGLSLRASALVYIYIPYPRFQGVPFLPRHSQG